jgi:hypothetical protein
MKLVGDRGSRAAAGYQVAVTGPATVVSAADAAILELESTGAGQVTVAVTKR